MAAVKTVSLTKEYSNGEHYLRAVMIYLSQLKKMNL